MKSSLPLPAKPRSPARIAPAESAGTRARTAERARAGDHHALVAAACRRLESGEPAADLATLARQAGLSPSHFHRVFKAVTGLTPKSYGAALRAERLRTELRRCDTVTTAIFDAGYGSNARVYEKSGEVLGMTPNAYRAGGVDADIRFAVGQCSLGAILVAQSERGICAILLGEDPEVLLRDLQDRFPKARLHAGDASFESRVATVIGFVEAPAIGLRLPLDIRGTAFQQRVWQALRAIPPGSTASYTEIARRIGTPRAVRAVAAACAANPLAVAIPCHRVVRIDGDLAGYRWGIERKRALLRRESSG